MTDLIDIKNDNNDIKNNDDIKNEEKNDNNFKLPKLKSITTITTNNITSNSSKHNYRRLLLPSIINIIKT